MKKVFAIVSIVLILFVSIVPAFAETETESHFLDYQISLQNIYLAPNQYSNSFELTSDGFIILGDFTASNGFYLRGFIPGHRYIFTFSAKSDYAAETSYFRPYTSANPSSLQPTFFCNVGLDYTFNSFDFIFDPEEISAGSANIRLRYRVGNDMAGHSSYVQFKNVNIFDVTGTDLTIDDLSHYINLEEFYPTDQTHATLIGFFDPLQDFWLSFTHLFDYFPQLISTYSGLFVFVTICLSLCLVTFIVVMVIKRCRNI